MDFLSVIPIPALIVLALIIVLIIAVVFLIVRKRASQAPSPENVLTQPSVEDQSANISPRLAKPNEGRFVILIIFGASLAILIPLIALYIVRSQIIPPESSTSSQLAQPPTCSAITITDTLAAPLTQEDLSQLRPGDEIKILISSTGENLDKARFRVNGSAWQELNLKDGDNFVANYILSEGYKKFTIETEVHDKNKGWL